MYRYGRVALWSLLVFGIAAFAAAMTMPGQMAALVPVENVARHLEHIAQTREQRAYCRRIADIAMEAFRDRLRGRQQTRVTEAVNNRPGIAREHAEDMVYRVFSTWWYESEMQIGQRAENLCLDRGWRTPSPERPVQMTTAQQIEQQARYQSVRQAQEEYERGRRQEAARQEADSRLSGLNYCNTLRPVARDAVLWFSTGADRRRLMELLDVPAGIDRRHVDIIVDLVFNDFRYRDAERVQNLASVHCMEQGWLLTGD